MFTGIGENNHHRKVVEGALTTSLLRLKIWIIYKLRINTNFSRQRFNFCKQITPGKLCYSVLYFIKNQEVETVKWGLEALFMCFLPFLLPLGCWVYFSLLSILSNICFLLTAGFTPSFQSWANLFQQYKNRTGEIQH